jgi:hypothetical protein
VSLRVSPENLSIVRKLHLDVRNPGVCLKRYLDVVSRRQRSIKDEQAIKKFREECLLALNVFWKGDQGGLVKAELLGMINPFYVLGLEQDYALLENVMERFGFRKTGESSLVRQTFRPEHQHLRTPILNTGKTFVFQSESYMEEAFENLDGYVVANRSKMSLIIQKKKFVKSLDPETSASNNPKPVKQPSKKPVDSTKKPPSKAQLDARLTKKAKSLFGISMVPGGRLERSVSNAVYATSLKAGITYLDADLGLHGVSKRIAEDFIADVKGLMSLVDLGTAYVFKIIGMLNRCVLAKLHLRSFKENLPGTLSDSVGQAKTPLLDAFLDGLSNEDLVVASHALSGTVNNTNQREYFIRLLYRFFLDRKFCMNSRTTMVEKLESLLRAKQSHGSTTPSPTLPESQECIDDVDVECIGGEDGEGASLEDEQGREKQKEEQEEQEDDENDDDEEEDNEDGEGEPECDANGRPLKAECKAAREAFKACFPNLTKEKANAFLFDLASCALADDDMFHLLPPAPTAKEKAGSTPLYEAAARQVATSLANTGVSHFNLLKQQLSSTKINKFALLRNLEIAFPENDKRYAISPLVAAGLANSTRFKVSPESDNTPNAHTISESFLKKSIVNKTRPHHSNHTKKFYKYLCSEEFGNSGASLSDALVFNAGGKTNDSLRRAMDGVPRHYKYSKSKPPQTERDWDVIMNLIEKDSDGRFVYDNCRIKFKPHPEGKRIPRLVWTGTIVTDSVGFRLQCVPVYDRYGGGKSMAKLKSKTFEIGRMIPEHSAPQNTPSPPAPEPTRNIFLEYDRQLCLEAIQSIRQGIHFEPLSMETSSLDNISPAPDNAGSRTESASSSAPSPSLESHVLDDSTVLPDCMDVDVVTELSTSSASLPISNEPTFLLPAFENGVDVDWMSIDDSTESLNDVDMGDISEAKELKPLVSESDEETFLGVAESCDSEGPSCRGHGKCRDGCRACSDNLHIGIIEKICRKLRVVGVDLGVIFAIAASVINEDGSLQNLAVSILLHFFFFFFFFFF